MAIVGSPSAWAAKKEKKAASDEVVAELYALNYHEGRSQITPGTNFAVELGALLRKAPSSLGRSEIPVAFFLLPKGFEGPYSRELLEQNGTLLGHSPLIFGGGVARKVTRIAVRSDLSNSPGDYNLVAWSVTQDEGKEKKAIKEQFAGPLAVTVSNERIGLPYIEVV